MATLLLELFSEEIPSRMQRGAAEQLQRLTTDSFKKAGLAHGEVKTFVSPRHLAIQLAGLPSVQPDVTEEKKGPKVGAPEQAMKGFLNSVGLTAEQCEQRDGYYFAVIHRKGRAMAEVAKEICERALNDFVWPKSMKWGAHTLQWVRPLHRIVCLLDDKVVPMQFGHLTADNKTEGHRFLAPGVITLKHAEEYADKLKAANVVVDAAARREEIAAEVASLAKLHALEAVNDPALLDEVTGLIEWPVPLIGTFDASFLDLPPEVLISEMKVHQRYFALRDAKGKLTNKFIAIANMVTSDEGKKVIEGNARVLRARLSDGAFYWEQDKKTSLEQWGKKLSDVVFHAKVGMLDKKVDRIGKLAAQIAKEVGYKDTKMVARAALLAKADLTSGMVGEFPDLQGIMGRYYATAQGEPQEVADAIRDHYKPLGANDSVPESQLAAIIAVADKLDSIISLFAAGEKPTGSKDPFALRRAALGVLRIVRHYKWDLDIALLITDEKVKNEIITFFADRMQNMLRDEGYRHDIVNSLTIFKSDYLNHFYPYGIGNHAQIVQDLVGKYPEALVAVKRALQLVAAEEKKQKSPIVHNPEKLKLAQLDAEKSLATVIGKGSGGDMINFPLLTAPINKFFDDVLVNDENPETREMRLNLLAGVRSVTEGIADFSKIEG